MPRFALIEHTAAPADPLGRHFDLLLEAGEACRTWRLMDVPQAGGPCVAAMEIVPHRLAWLDHVDGEISGGRGFARRIAAGTFELLSSDAVGLVVATECVVRIESEMLAGRLRLETIGTGWAVSLRPDVMLGQA